MPKVKTRKSAAKRFRFTGTDKIKRGHAFTSHLLSGKSSKRKRCLRKTTLVSAADSRQVKRLMPYGTKY